MALTFDDGPGPWTPAVLRVLNAEHVKATFFEIGSQVADTPSWSKMVSAAGMPIESHTYTHLNMLHASDSRIQWEMSKTRAAIMSAVGVAPKCVRPPGGAEDARVHQQITAAGYSLVLWSVDPRDWSRPGTQTIVQRVLGQVRPGSVILMHDGGGDRSETLAALPTIIHSLKQQGYSFVTLFG